MPTGVIAADVGGIEKNLNRALFACSRATLSNRRCCCSGLASRQEPPCIWPV